VSPGAFDRREKCLSTTVEGHRLARELARLQTARIEAALDRLPPGGRQVVADFLAGLVDEAERAEVLGRIEGGRR
jgi:DNA-binding MarR family transcriptional regulator